MTVFMYVHGKKLRGKLHTYAYIHSAYRFPHRMYSLYKSTLTSQLWKLRSQHSWVPARLCLEASPASL